MQAIEFCYWLQGYMELTDKSKTPTLTKEQVECVQEHLNLVFTKVTGDDQEYCGQEDCTLANILSKTSSAAEGKANMKFC